jgi:hypothetical protein
MNNSKSVLLAFVAAIALLGGLAGCTTAAVDPGQTRQMKTVTVTRFSIPEYAYVGRDGAAVGQALSTVAAAYAFGVFGAVGSDIARSKMEEPFRKAIKEALDPHSPDFATATAASIENSFAARGVKVNWVGNLSRLSDNSGYDLSLVDADTDFLVELFPFTTGFSYSKEACDPIVDMRWRLLKRYAIGKYVETNRGTVYYDALIGAGSPGSVRLPVNSDYRFPGHANALRLHGDKPAIAMRAIGTQLGEVIAEKVMPGSK